MDEHSGLWVPQEGVPILTLSKSVIRMDKGFWHVYRTKLDADFSSISGKYLFFSSSYEELEKIAIDEIENHGFILAKINDQFYKKGPDFVMCLYHKDEARKTELLKRYKDSRSVKYRFWKSNEDTLKGKYSERYQKTIRAEKRGW